MLTAEVVTYTDDIPVYDVYSMLIRLHAANPDRDYWLDKSRRAIMTRARTE